MTLILAAVCMSIWADERTESQALKEAQQFVSSHNHMKSAPTVKSAGQVSGLYVFNVSNGGFVIVSNDDQTVPILGFGDSGNIDPNDLPDNMRAWLQGYADQIAWLQSHASDGNDVNNKSRAPQRTDKTEIGPLVTTNWNQGIPYYNLCPTIDGERTVTGCVATTMAQLMYYHYAHNNFTASSTAIPGYTTSTKDKNGASYSLTVSGLEATSFDWGKMIANYTPVNTETGNLYLAGTTDQQQAVAKLMLYCGTALQMNYGLGTNGGSGAYSEAIPYALKTYFGYDGGIQHCYRKNYSYTDWMDLIYIELAAARPVALGGQSTGGGHSFICDGYKYDTADYFHINWGWAGISDGYFPLSVLNPDDQGIGGSSSLDGFSFGQDAVIGIQPPVGGNADYCLSLEGLRLNSNKTSGEFTRASETDNFTDVNLYYLVYNYNYGSNAYDVAVQLVDSDGKVVHTLGGQNNQTKTWNQAISGTLSNLSIPSTVGGGTYYIKVMSRPHNDPAVAWQECYDGDAYKLTATISEDKLKLTINVPITANVTPASVTFAVSGESSSTGVEKTVTATVTGGTGDYSGDLVLRVNGTAVVGQVAQIPAGKKVELFFSYIPSQVGDNTLTLWTHRSSGSQIPGSETVTISTLVFDNDGSNNANLLETNNGRTGDVKLAGRTLTKDGNWNTLCLPFNVEDGDTNDELTFTGTPLEGATVKEMDASGTSLDDGTLTLKFNTVTAIDAGKPYIVRWGTPESPVGGNIVNPVFPSVTINSAAPIAVKSSDNKVTFVGQYSPFSIVSSGAKGSDQGNLDEILMLGAQNKLGYSQSARSLKCFRAHFYVKSDGSAQAARAFVVDFGDGDDETTGIMSTTDFTDYTEKADAWFTLDGRKLGGQPTKKGVYINNGKKVVIK